MKKLVTLLALTVFALALTGCNRTNIEETPTDDTTVGETTVTIPSTEDAVEVDVTEKTEEGVY